eukprot:TRINITY_DN291_c0_g1_i4.p1 TRINITY_DN291_c0_g1~~TRINITY_DN291_c0_g1_i4.p1  ORF type:complete len:100 (-),score=42.12 TRINITY_DN291_c0_g1_i4:23-322(-)
MCIRDRYQRRVRGGSETVRMLTEHGKALHQTWEALPRRSGEQLPVWQDIKAACIAPIMKHLWVLEYQPPEALIVRFMGCLLYTSPSPRDRTRSRMPSSA